MTQTNAATEEYIPNDESLDSLRNTHQQLEKRLEELDSQRSLSPEEEYEVQVLKKRKLALKDRIIEKQNGT